VFLHRCYKFHSFIHFKRLKFKKILSNTAGLISLKNCPAVFYYLFFSSNLYPVLLRFFKEPLSSNNNKNKVMLINLLFLLCFIAKNARINELFAFSNFLKNLKVKIIRLFFDDFELKRKKFKLDFHARIKKILIE